MTTGRVRTVVFGDVKPGAQRTPVFAGVCRDMRSVNKMERPEDMALLWRSNSASVRKAAYQRLAAGKARMVQVYNQYGIKPSDLPRIKAHMMAVRAPIVIPDLVRASLVKQIASLQVRAMIRNAVRQEIRELPPWELEKLRLRFAPKHR